MMPRFDLVAGWRYNRGPEQKLINKFEGSGEVFINLPVYSIIELALEMSLDASSNGLLLDMRPGGRDPGPRKSHFVIPSSITKLEFVL